MERIHGARFITVASDGWLYIAGSDGGYFARHLPGSQSVEVLGRPISSETYLFDVVPGNDGEVLGATYPGCRVFRYHPADGFSVVGEGPIAEGENYARNIAYHRSTQKLYVGVGSHTHLIEYDMRRKAKRELLPEQYLNKPGFVTHVRVLEDNRNGDKLFVNVEGKTLIYDLTHGRLEAETEFFDIESAILSLKGDCLFYTKKAGLFSRDLSDPNIKPKKIAPVANALAMFWSKDKGLYVLSKNQTLVRYDPESGQVTSTVLDVPLQAINIRLTQAGPDGRIWCTGYPMGPNSAYDPVSKRTEIYEGLTQAESMTVQDNNIYFGIYPHGRIYRLDTTKPWNLAAGNPSRIADIPGQDRPFGGVSLPEYHKMYFGTVPAYGKLGGALVEYDVDKEKVEIFTDVVHDLSIVSLAYADGVVVGGTSVKGGMGIAPAAHEAKLFGWDPVSKKKLFELVPLDSARSITCLITGPDGNIWGVADGTLFVFDPAERKIVSRQLLFKDYNGMRWIDTRLVVHPSGDVYGTGNNELFRVDASTFEVTKLLKDASWLSMDKKGRLYFSRSDTDLWSYEP